MRGMKTICKVLLVNGSCLLGFVIVGVLNPDASAVFFGISCLVALVLINGVFFFLPWLRQRRGQPATNATKARSSSETNFWLAFSWFLFLLSLLLTWMRRRGYW
jgi:NADH:ubiquinone oxidoreductase subunit 2 (subunit N)